MSTINEIYKNILIDLYINGETRAPRGIETKEIRPYSFTLENIEDNIITIPDFETNIKYAKKEFEWYKKGDGYLLFAPNIIKKIWRKYSDDGKNVNSNYGERIFGRHSTININQWNWVKEILEHDRHSRRAIININSYFDKINPHTKDFPCTQYLQFFITNDNKIEMIANMGSNDVYFGLRNDLYCFTEFQKKMAKELNLKFGKYTHFAGSMHLYKKQFSKIEKLINTV